MRKNLSSSISTETLKFPTIKQTYLYIMVQVSQCEHGGIQIEFQCQAFPLRTRGLTEKSNSLKIKKKRQTPLLFFRRVGRVGLEPTWFYPGDFKSYLVLFLPYSKKHSFYTLSFYERNVQKPYQVSMHSILITRKLHARQGGRFSSR